MRGEHTAVISLHTNNLRLTEMSPILAVSSDDEIDAGHRGRERPAEEREHGRREIGEAAAVAELDAEAVTTSGTGFVVCAV